MVRRRSVEPERTMMSLWTFRYCVSLARVGLDQALGAFELDGYRQGKFSVGLLGRTQNLPSVGIIPTGVPELGIGTAVDAGDASLLIRLLMS